MAAPTTSKTISSNASRPHSLAALLKKTRFAKGQKIQIVGEDKPHVIDLLDALGY